MGAYTKKLMLSALILILFAIAPAVSPAHAQGADPSEGISVAELSEAQVRQMLLMVLGERVQSEAPETDVPGWRIFRIWVPALMPSSNA